MHHPHALLAQWYEAALNADIPARYNISPGCAVHVLRGIAGEREIASMRWGFIPSWAEDPACVPMLHNARGETVAEKPMFRQAFRQRRCLVPASGYYEWKGTSGNKQRRPFYLSLRDGTPMSFAGVWDSFATPSGEAIETCAIVTTKANVLLEPVHPRMPVLLARNAWARWLDADTPVAELLALLHAFPVDSMQMWEVADAVNAVHDDDPGLMQPLAGNSQEPGTEAALL